MEGKLIISNHPDTYRMIIPTARFLSKQPETTVVCWTVIGHLLLDHFTPTIHVETKAYTEHILHRQLLQQFTRFLFPSQKFEHVPYAVHRVLSEGKDVLIFPAGAPPFKGVERRWQSGIGTIIKHLSQSNTPFSIEFVYMRSAVKKPIIVPITPPLIASENPRQIADMLYHQYQKVGQEIGKRD